VKRLIDVRLHNSSQLAGFAKAADLAYFAREICGIETEHHLELAPTDAVFEGLRKDRKHWEENAAKFRALIARRKIEKLERKLFDGACLLCSEDQPHHCHRRLVAEYLREKWGGVEIEHL